MLHEVPIYISGLRLDSSRAPTLNRSIVRSLSAQRQLGGYTIRQRLDELAPHDTGAAWADPALAAGSDRLLTADEPDFNVLYNPQHGDDQYGNYGAGLGGWMGAALPNNGSGFQITQPV